MRNAPTARRQCRVSATQRPAFRRRLAASTVAMLLWFVSASYALGQAPPTSRTPPTPPQTTPATPLPAGEDVQIRTFAPDNALHLGEALEIRVEVTHPPGFRFESPDSTRINPGRLRLIEVEHTSPAPPAESEIDVFVFRCAVFFVGRFYFPPVDLMFLDADGVRRVIRSEHVSVKVASMLLDDDADPELRDNLLPNVLLEPDHRPLQGALVLFFALALVALGVLLTRRAKRRRLARPSPVTPPRPAWEVAWEKLQALQEKLPNEETRRELYFDLSEIMRAYLGTRYDFDALEMTTSEVIAALREVRLPRGIDKHALETFFLECDLVKFARYEVSLDETSANLSAAQSVVEQTRPSAPQAPTNAPAGGTHVG